MRTFAIIALAGATLHACGHPAALPAEASSTTASSDSTMTIEIWSDIVCPFCYIGKKELEKALEDFPERDKVRVVWRSFELDPSAPDSSPHDMCGMLVEKYGGTRADAKARVDAVVGRGRSVGVGFDMDKAVVSSSFQAHRLLQFAKEKGLGGEAKERLFRAYFTEGAHLADGPTLVRLGTEIGLDAMEVERMLAGDAYTDAVRADEAEAMRLGVRGVPFFLFDGKLGMSGAQTNEVFSRTLRKAWEGR